MYYFEQQMAVTDNPTSPTDYGAHTYFLWPECVTADGFFEDVNRAKSKWQTAQVIDNGELKVDPDVRDHLLQVIEYNPSTVGLFRELYNHVNSVNHWHFNFKLWSMENISLYQFNLGHKLAMHSDKVFMLDLSERKFTVLVGLSDMDSYTGGELVISPHGNPEFESPIRLNRGDVVVIPSWVPYEVKQVEKGTLEMLATWVYGPKFV